MLASVCTTKDDVRAYQRWECVPRPKRDHKPKPGEEENPAVHVDGVESRNRVRLSVHRVDLWGLVEVRELDVDTHLGCG